jgi:hypothetical protein
MSIEILQPRSLSEVVNILKIPCLTPYKCHLNVMSIYVV